MKSQYIVVLVTAKDRRQARRIAQGLLKKKLIACANIIQGIESIFLWQGKIDKVAEVLLLLKTRKSLFQALVQEVKSLHSYQTPEIIALPIVMGDNAYLAWLKESVC